MFDYITLLNALVGLLIIVNPFGGMIIYLSLTRRMNWRDARRMARVAAVSSGIILALAMVGEFVLNFFSISIEAFAISGGILMFIVGLAMVQAQQPLTNQTEQETEEGMHRGNMGVVPLGTPALAGPGGITFMIISAREASAPLDYVGLVLIVAIAAFLIYLTLAYSRRLLRVFGRTGINIMGRVAGIFVLAIGVEMIISNVMQFVSRY